ncbi:MAG: TolC family protein [Rubrivivax sp.]
MPCRRCRRACRPRPHRATRRRGGAALARVEAASREVDLARAQFYPNISLVAFAVRRATRAGTSIEAGSRTYGIGPAVRLPIFDGGRLRANLGAKAAEADIAVETYNATLLRALREVADESALAGGHRSTAARAEAKLTLPRRVEPRRMALPRRAQVFAVVLTAEAGVLMQRRGATRQGNALPSRSEQRALLLEVGGVRQWCAAAGGFVPQPEQFLRERRAG